MITYYELKITETSRTCPKEEEGKPFNRIIEKFKTINNVKNFIVDRYGKIPGMKNKIYVDDKDNNATEVGFLHSFWNRDISHNSKAWYQTDWITIKKVTKKEKIILL